MKINSEILNSQKREMEKCERERVKQLSLVVSTIPLFSSVFILFFTNPYTVTSLLCKT